MYLAPCLLAAFVALRCEDCFLVVLIAIAWSGLLSSYEEVVDVSATLLLGGSYGTR